ncbi:phenylalanine--tRNA ligase subunit alpha, partial [Mycoplasmopsis pullorum]
MLKLDDIKTFEDLKLARSKVYSKDGEIFQLQNQIKSADVETKKLLGQKITELKRHYEEFFIQAEAKLEQEKINQKINSEFVDVTVPVYVNGSLHPITLVENRLKDWFIQHGYFQTEDGEIVDDLYNFERLNIPSNHPARAMHDSLYFSAIRLLRTHNTGITALELEKNANKSFS